MAVIDTNPGFKLMGRISGGPTTVQTFKFKDTETLTKGDFVNLESGEVDLAATNDTAIVGIVLETKAGTDSTTEIEVVVDPDAIYAVYDANARNAGDKLDIAGATGAMTVAAASNNDLIVFANSAADELTLVRINPASHPFES